MAQMTWICPQDKDVTSQVPGTCPECYSGLVQQTPQQVPEPRRTRPILALDCPWQELVEVPGEGLDIGREMPPFRGGGIRRFDQISRRHAQLRWNEDQLYVADLCSLNHTYVNDAEVKPDSPVALPAGALLRLGDDVVIRIVELNEYGEPL